jgi:hypothetical protein
MMSPGMADAKRYPEQKDTMARMMAKWFEEHGVPPNLIFCNFSARVWGTRAEICNAIGFIMVNFRSYTAVEFVSSTYHVLRVRIIAERVIAGLWSDQICLLSFTSKNYPASSTLLEIRNVLGEFLLGGIHKEWYHPQMSGNQLL